MDLHNELTRLRRMILSMGASVEQRVAEAFDSVLARDINEARAVRTSDDEIDAMDLDVEAECLRILALSHPVAGDLRFVLSVIRINTDLERMADLATSIAKRVIAMDDQTSPIELPPALAEMASCTQRMLGDALKALADEDAALCYRVRKSDDRVDDLLKELFVWAQQEIPRNVETTPFAINVLSIARKIERIADMTTNIAEDVLFLIDGSIVRHSKS